MTIQYIIVNGHQWDLRNELTLHWCWSFCDDGSVATDYKKGALAEVWATKELGEKHWTWKKKKKKL